MEFAIRDIQPQECAALHRAAKACFSFFENIGISKPKQGIVAEENGNLCGGAFLQYVDCADGKRIGYLDVIFVCKAYRGSGVADLLYRGAAERVHECGAAFATAMIIDENMPSKTRAEAAGLHESTFLEMSRQAGWGGAAKFCLRFFAPVLFGCNIKLYSDMPEHKAAAWQRFFCMALFNLVLLGLGRLIGRGFSWVPPVLLGGVVILLTSTLANWLGALVAGGRWRYTVPSGGVLLTIILHLFGYFYPWMGRMYPLQYENTPACKKRLGVSALVEWLAVLAVTLICSRFAAPSLEMAAIYGGMFLLYRAVPCYPFNTWGTKRVWNWNKPLCVVLMAASLAMFILVRWF